MTSLAWLIDNSHCVLWQVTLSTFVQCLDNSFPLYLTKLIVGHLQSAGPFQGSNIYCPPTRFLTITTKSTIPVSKIYTKFVRKIVENQYIPMCKFTIPAFTCGCRAVGPCKLEEQCNHPRAGCETDPSILILPRRCDDIRNHADA